MKREFAWDPGRAIRYEEQGQGPVLIGLHGLGGGSYFFHGLGARLKNSIRTIAWDMPGLGQNFSAVETFSFADCASCLLDFTDHECNAPVSLLAHSMGAIVALKAYAKRPENFSRIVFLGGLPRPVPAIRERLLKRCEQIEAMGMAAVCDEAAAGVFSARTKRSQPHLIGMYARLLEQNDPDRYLQNIRSLVDASADEAIESLQVQCLAITGEEDKYASPDDIAIFANAIPKPTPVLVYEHCGHMIFFEEPARLEADLREFLDGL